MSIRSLYFSTALAVLLAPSLIAAKIPSRCYIGDFAVGCQAYTFNRFTALEAIDMTADAGGKIIEFYPGQKFSAGRPGVQFNHNLSADDLATLKQKLKDRHIRMVNYGVVGASDEKEWRKIFQFAKDLHLYGITTEAVDQLDTIEKLVKEFDIRVCIHEHAKRDDDSNYKVWDPKYVLSMVEARDSRIGACADTGHWMTSGLDPLECVKILKGRIMSCHLKDYDKLGADGHCVPFGTGVGEIKDILDELKAENFKGNISIEYEYHFDYPVPEVKQCVDFMRDYGAKK